MNQCSREGSPKFWHEVPEVLKREVFIPQAARFLEKLATRGAHEPPPQSWLPDTFIERAYRTAQLAERPEEDCGVILTAFEASAIRLPRVSVPHTEPPPDAISDKQRIAMLEAALKESGRIVTELNKQVRALSRPERPQ